MNQDATTRATLSDTTRYAADTTKTRLFDLMTLEVRPMTHRTAQVFTGLAEAAAQCGSPVEFFAYWQHADLGNLSHLKTSGLVESGKQGKGKARQLVVVFTAAGAALAAEVWGLNVPVSTLAADGAEAEEADDEAAAARAAIAARAEAEAEDDGTTDEDIAAVVADAKARRNSRRTRKAA